MVTRYDDVLVVGRCRRSILRIENACLLLRARQRGEPPRCLLPVAVQPETSGLWNRSSEGSSGDHGGVVILLILCCCRRAGTLLDPPRKPEDTIASQQSSSEIFPAELVLLLLLLLHPIVVVVVVCKVIVAVVETATVPEISIVFGDIQKRELFGLR